MRFFVITAAIAALLIPVRSKAQVQLKVGDKVPEFMLPYATQDTVIFDGFGSKNLTGKRYLLAFYPADWSSGCTKEVCRFRDTMVDFEGLNIEVLGVSVDNPFSHRQWAKAENLNFKLLSDQTHKLGQAMGVYNDKTGMFQRSVFVVGQDGTLKYVNYNYSVKDDKDFATLKEALAAM
jgi:glutaredoxin-dependent peroxiredoxin